MRNAFIFALLALVACSDSEELGSSQDGLTAGRLLDESEVASLLAAAGVPGEDVPKMVCIAQYESGLHERSTHHNADGSTDWGLFQINDVHRGRTAGCPASSAALLVAETNTACAANVARGTRGLANWSAYRSHRAECDAYRVAGYAPTEPTPEPTGNAGSYGAQQKGGATSDEDAGVGAPPSSCDPYVDPTCDPYAQGEGQGQDDYGAPYDDDVDDDAGDPWWGYGY